MFKLNRILRWELLKEEFTPPTCVEEGQNAKSATLRKNAKEKESETMPLGKSGKVEKSEALLLGKPETKPELELAPQREQEKQDELVRLRFPKEMAFRVYDEFEDRQVKREENGDYLVTAFIRVDDWVLSFLLSFGTQVEVVEPEYLRKLLAAKVMELYEKYKALTKLDIGCQQLNVMILSAGHRKNIMITRRENYAKTNNKTRIAASGSGKIRRVEPVHFDHDREGIIDTF